MLMQTNFAIQPYRLDMMDGKDAQLDCAVENIMEVVCLSIDSMDSQ